MNLSKNGKRIGRPPGSKNGSTLLKEAAQARLKNQLDTISDKEAPKVLKVVIKKALEGDMQAAKMILDRKYPIEHAQRAQKPIIEINVETLNAQATVGREINAQWEERTPQSTVEVQTIDAGDAWPEEDETGSEIDLEIEARH